MSDWFTSDWHLGHTNIIQYSHRPFWHVDQMDDTIIANVNDRVKENDRLFNLGDVAFRKDKLAFYRARLICKNIFVIPGNHDKEKELVKHFTVLPQCYMYENAGFRIVLCHYAMRVWLHSHHGAGHLFGHSHSALPGTSTSMDVGVDCWDYKPISLDQIKTEFSRRAKVLDSVNTTTEGSGGDGKRIIGYTFDDDTPRSWMVFPSTKYIHTKEYLHHNVS
jgi:calcineurin-like phosphoesterase family protein